METIPKPPSIYEYRSELEWNQAMYEWCHDFEPKDETPYYVRMGVYASDGSEPQTVTAFFRTASQRRIYINQRASYMNILSIGQMNTKNA